MSDKTLKPSERRALAEVGRNNIPEHHLELAARKTCENLHRKGLVYINKAGSYSITIEGRAVLAEMKP